eukprot:TRINITY_DN119528_c0_g1_i1.p1 TRINITY_DN119528_c0_g1~~TRINITY_DN119528_c0_g1_i1.p1  ORF type:complete len:175 (+),score=27.61 TRINITY_DN119528_c0_g1_i1:168-692(+)
MPENAADIPTGEYQNTCNGCRLEENMLLCSHCAKACGKRIESSVDLSSCNWQDGGKIINHDGTLRCEDPLPPNGDNLPQGTFSGSCHGCKVEGDLLECVACLDGAQNRHLTSIRLSACTHFGNKEGELACDEGGESFEDVMKTEFARSSYSEDVKNVPEETGARGEREPGHTEL